jgi:phosphoribosylformylglycinamidine cyclo-ligase
MIAVVASHAADVVIEKLGVDGFPAWVAGVVSTGALPGGTGFEQGAKGVNGGAVRLTGSYRS